MFALARAFQDAKLAMLSMDVPPLYGKGVYPRVGGPNGLGSKEDSEEIANEADFISTPDGNYTPPGCTNGHIYRVRNACFTLHKIVDAMSNCQSKIKFLCYVAESLEGLLSHSLKTLSLPRTPIHRAVSRRRPRLLQHHLLPLAAMPISDLQIF
jgi:hypothetical protein